MPRVVGGSRGGGRFRMGEVPLYRVFQGGCVGIQQEAREAILDLGEKDLSEYQRGRPPTNKVTGLPHS